NLLSDQQTRTPDGRNCRGPKRGQGGALLGQHDDLSWASHCLQEGGRVRRDSALGELASARRYGRKHRNSHVDGPPCNEESIAGAKVLSGAPSSSSNAVQYSPKTFGQLRPLA